MISKIKSSKMHKLPTIAKLHRTPQQQVAISTLSGNVLNADKVSCTPPSLPISLANASIKAS